MTATEEAEFKSHRLLEPAAAKQQGADQKIKEDKGREKKTEEDKETEEFKRRRVLEPAAEQQKEADQKIKEDKEREKNTKEGKERKEGKDTEHQDGAEHSD